MFAGDCLFGVLFGDFVGFGGDEGDEFDAAFDQQVARVFGKRHARLAGEDILDNLLDSRWGVLAFTGRYEAENADLWAATSRRCRQIRGQTWWVNARQRMVLALSLGIGRGRSPAK
jgi:hypothetical protein